MANSEEIYHQIHELTETTPTVEDKVHYKYYYISRNHNLIYSNPIFLRGGPGDVVEVGVRIFRLDERPEPPDGGGVCDVRPFQAPFRSPRVEEANHATESVNDEGARVPLGGEDARTPIVIVDGQLHGLLFGVVVANKRIHACGASDGEISSVTVFEDDEAGLVVVIEQVGVGQELF
jgi:hypothetical protein